MIIIYHMLSLVNHLQSANFLSPVLRLPDSDGKSPIFINICGLKRFKIIFCTMCSVPCAVTCHAFSRTKRTCCHFLDRLQACMAMRKLFSLESPFIPFIPWLSLRPMTFRSFRSFRICKVLSH